MKPKSRSPSTTPPEPLPVLRGARAVLHVSNMDQLKLVRHNVFMALKRDDIKVRKFTEALSRVEYSCTDEDGCNAVPITQTFLDDNAPVYVYTK